MPPIGRRTARTPNRQRTTDVPPADLDGSRGEPTTLPRPSRIRQSAPRHPSRRILLLVYSLRDSTPAQRIPKLNACEITDTPGPRIYVQGIRQHSWRTSRLMVMRWIAAGAVLLGAPMFAQSPTGTFVLDRTSSHSVREYVAADVFPTQL